MFMNHWLYWLRLIPCMNRNSLLRTPGHGGPWVLLHRMTVISNAALNQIFAEYNVNIWAGSLFVITSSGEYSYTHKKSWEQGGWNNQLKAISTLFATIDLCAGTFSWYLCLHIFPGRQGWALIHIWADQNWTPCFDSLLIQFWYTQKCIHFEVYQNLIDFKTVSCTFDPLNRRSCIIR